MRRAVRKAGLAQAVEQGLQDARALTGVGLKMRARGFDRRVRNDRAQPLHAAAPLLIPVQQTADRGIEPERGRGIGPVQQRLCEGVMGSAIVPGKKWVVAMAVQYA